MDEEFGSSLGFNWNYKSDDYDINNYGSSSYTPTTYDFSNDKKRIADYNKLGGYKGLAERSSKFAGDFLNDALLAGAIKPEDLKDLTSEKAQGLFDAAKSTYESTLLNGSGGKSWSDWFGDKGNQFMVHTGLGLGQLGLGLASYLQQSDFMKKQGKLLDQQLASNQYEMDRRQGFSRDIRDPNGAFATSYNAVRNA